MSQTEIPAPKSPLASAGLNVERLAGAIRSAGPPLLFGLRLWASVCFALYVAFWLQLDNAYWAGGTAAIVCQPHLGASLRKGWFRMVGTLAEAAVQQAQVNAQNAAAQALRRRELTTLSTSVEVKQTYQSTALANQAAYQQAVANLKQAQVNLKRTHIHSPVNGYVTNLLAQLGDYATVGQNEISLVNADSFWVDGYFEETNLGAIHVGDPATIKLMGYSQIVRGHVSSIARAINVANAQPDLAGLATVNPIFTWVRLAQRIPVRIHIDRVPDGVHLVSGMTATVQIDPQTIPSRAAWFP